MANTTLLRGAKTQREKTIEPKFDLVAMGVDQDSIDEIQSYADSHNITFDEAASGFVGKGASHIKQAIRQKIRNR